MIEAMVDVELNELEFTCPMCKYEQVIDLSEISSLFCPTCLNFVSPNLLLMINQMVRRKRYYTDGV